MLVTMLVAGVAISVREYLESGRVSAHSSSVRACSEATPQKHSRGTCGSVPVGNSFGVEPASAERSTACDRATSSGAATESAPGVWTPDARSTGS
jgi:hypothetical protein